MSSGMGMVERQALVSLVREALEFCNWAAGEGICRGDYPNIRGPEDFLFEYSEAIGADDWEGLPGAIANQIDAALQDGENVKADQS